MSNLELERFEFMPLIKYNLQSTIYLEDAAPVPATLASNALNNAPSNRAATSLPTSPPHTPLPCSAYSTIGNDSFSTVSLSRYYCCCLSLSLSAAVYSASFAVAETRTQDLFSHLYVCKGRKGRGGGAQGEELAGM